MTNDELLDKIEAWAFAEGENDWTPAASFDYSLGFRDACDTVRGLIQANREPGGSRCQRSVDDEITGRDGAV
jgi:hypothetical protein